MIGKLEFKTGSRKMTRHKGYFDMAVDLNFRGKGVGGLLLKGLLNWARHRPLIEVIQLEVVEENTPAVALYKKSGFKEIGRDPSARKVDKRFFSELTMSLVISKN